jgi:hypothetical protein
VLEVAVTSLDLPETSPQPTLAFTPFTCHEVC